MLYESVRGMYVVIYNLFRLMSLCGRYSPYLFMARCPDYEENFLEMNTARNEYGLLLNVDCN